MAKSPKACSRGKVYRRSYTRRSPSGKKIRIAASCVKSPAKYKKSPRRSPVKSPVRIKVRKGTLSKYGYKTIYSTRERREALELAVEHEGWLPIFRKLNIIAVFNKNKNPELSELLIRDRNWVRTYLSD